MPSPNRPIFDFEGKSVLVTGGTSGMGAATVDAFRQSGASVVFGGRNQERADAIIARSSGAREAVHFVAGDVTDPEYCDGLLAKTQELVGGPDIVVNSAGVIYHATVDETTDQQWLDTFNVNVHGMFYICRAAVPLELS